MRLPLVTYATGAMRHVAEPVEQNAGETQVVTLETAHDALVCWMVWLEQEYAGVQETERVAEQVLVTPPAVALPV